MLERVATCGRRIVVKACAVCCLALGNTRLKRNISGERVVFPRVAERAPTLDVAFCRTTGQWLGGAGCRTATAVAGSPTALVARGRELWWRRAVAVRQGVLCPAAALRESPLCRVVPLDYDGRAIRPAKSLPSRHKCELPTRLREARLCQLLVCWTQAEALPSRATYSGRVRFSHRGAAHTYGWKMRALT